jgi:hypothetical protein
MKNKRSTFPQILVAILRDILHSFGSNKSNKLNNREMKEYFFLKGKDQNGPFTVEQLADKGLTSETLIWAEGMENWQKLKDIPELAQTIKPKSVPPPPSDTHEKISKTEVSGQLKATTEKVPNLALEATKPNKTTLTWLIVWCSFHLLALLMSYSEVDIFNDSGKPQTDKFWPFVDFTHDVYSEEYYKRRSAGGVFTMLNSEMYDKEFNGIFTNYDWSEFAFYVGGTFVIYLLVRISNKQDFSNT